MSQESLTVTTGKDDLLPGPYLEFIARGVVPSTPGAPSPGAVFIRVAMAESEAWCFLKEVEDNFKKVFMNE